VIARRYELQRQLAQGGMAEVWLAVDLALDRKVAVKWLKPTLASDAVVAERFRREAIAAASLNHPNIVAVHDVFEQDGRQAVVMQLVEGKSLRQLLDTQKRLSPELTCHIGTCVALALDHAHEAGFVHRDVKPGNIMITSDGRVLLTDFGIAKGLQSADADLTSDNIMMGTAKYLSPEQVRGKKLDGRADLYSLGLVLYECLAGRVPFLGETDADTALARLQRDPTDLARLRATLPTALVTVIHQLLARNPASRPATGAELVEALREAAKEGPPVIDQTTADRSPILPFSTRRFRRAPSDELPRPDANTAASKNAARERQPPSSKGASKGASNGASRSAPKSASQATPSIVTPMVAAIPGEPSHTGRVPVQPTSRSTTPGTQRSTANSRTTSQPGVPPATRPSAPARTTPVRPVVRDRTPPKGSGRVDPATAQGMSNSWKPSMLVVAILLVVAVLIGGLLWFNLQYGGGDAVPTTTGLPGVDPVTGAPIGAADAPPTDTTLAVAPPPVAGPASIATITTFDPDGDNEENNEDAVLSGADGDATTSWTTECYSSQYMGAKRGVGLVVSFDKPTQQALSVDVINAPYQLRFFASDAAVAPADLDGWGPELGAKAFDSEPETVTSAIPAAPAAHMLVLLNEIGRDDACSESNPYRGRLGEITLVG
jgi:serine/threonine protein kinase